MKLYSFCRSSAAMVVIVLICFGGRSAIAQKFSTPGPGKPCAGLNCALVRIENVSRLGNSGELKYITASGKAGTYILSCTFECQVPLNGRDYEYSEQSAKKASDDRYAFLTGPKVDHEQYSLEVIVPELPPSEVHI